jgi:hypothetical protein
MSESHTQQDLIDHEDGFRCGYDNEGMWTDKSEAWLLGFAEGTELRLWFEALMEES